VPRVAQKLILDVDTGTDDAVAIMLAALHPEIELIGVTTVNGNVEVKFCTDNTLRVLDHIGRSDIPVYEGSNRPFVRDNFPVARGVTDQASKFHVETLPVPAAKSKKADKGAVDYLVETYRNAKEPIVLMPVGPLTNIAAALAADPDFAKRVPELIIMGGGHEIGNMTPSAEFNIWADPEAAARVFSAGFEKVTLVTLDATHRALISYADCDHLAMLGTPAAQATSDIVRFRIEMHDISQKMEVLGTAPVHDAVCVAYLVDRDVLTTRHLHVDVETGGALTVGRTVIDTHFRGNREPNAHVAFDADPKRFVAMLTEIFSHPHG
jgi:inosine-uridine nucleoside N-ribohydrolase